MPMARGCHVIVGSTILTYKMHIPKLACRLETLFLLHASHVEMILHEAMKFPQHVMGTNCQITQSKGMGIGD